MAAGIYNIIIEQGSTYTMIVKLNDGAVTPAPIDLTGYTGRGSIKLKATDTTSLADFIVTVTDPTEGEVTISLPASDSEAIETKGTNYTEVLEAWYDIELVNGSEVIRLLNGACNISPEITK